MNKKIKLIGICMLMLMLVSNVFALTFSYDQASVFGSALDVNEIDFSKTYAGAPANDDGTLYWGSGEHTLNLDMIGSDVVLQIGEEMFIYAKNTEGSIINNGEIVYITGSSGDFPTVELATATDYEKGTGAIAMATEDIGIGSNGYFTVIGQVRGLDTSGLTEGVELYLSTTPGDYTETEPAKPNILAHVGYVIKSHPTEGIIFFRTPHIHEYLEESSNVQETGLITGDLLVYNLSSLMWENGYNIGNYYTKSDVYNKTYIDDRFVPYTGSNKNIYLFNDEVIGNDENGKSFKIYRNASEYTSVLEIFSNFNKAIQITANERILFDQSTGQNFEFGQNIITGTNFNFGSSYAFVNPAFNFKGYITGDGVNTMSFTIDDTTDSFRLYQSTGNGLSGFEIETPLIMDGTQPFKQGDYYEQYFDGTNQIFNITNGGEYHFYNGTNYGTINVHTVVEHSHNESENNSLEEFTENQNKWEVDLDVADKTKPIKKEVCDEVSYTDEEGKEVRYDYCRNITIGYETKPAKGTETGQKLKDVEGVLIDLNKNMNLYNNLTDFDSAIMTENIYTQSKTPDVDSEDYIGKLKDKDKLKNKKTHYAYVENIMGTEYDVLDLEERVVVLEGAVNEIFTILCDKNILKKEDGCLN